MIMFGCMTISLAFFYDRHPHSGVNVNTLRRDSRDEVLQVDSVLYDAVAARCRASIIKYDTQM